MTTRLSTKGQLIIPRAIRSRQGWRAGTRLVIEERGDHLVLRGLAEAPPTRLEDLIGCMRYRGRRRSLAEMEAAIALDTNLLVRLSKKYALSAPCVWRYVA